MTNDTWSVSFKKLGNELDGVLIFILMTVPKKAEIKY